jgi:hypothetical protein
MLVDGDGSKSLTVTRGLPDVCRAVRLEETNN